MSYSLVPFQVKFASDACILGLLLEAASESEKGRKEFAKNGKVYRATDYDPKLKQRVSVPLEKDDIPPPDTSNFFDLGAISRLASSGVEAVKTFLDNAFGKSAREFRGFLAAQWQGLGDAFVAIAQSDPFPEVTARAKKVMDFLGTVKGDVLSSIQQNHVVKALTGIIKTVHDKYNGVIYDLNHLEGPTWKKVAGKAIAIVVPVMAGVALGVLTESCIAMFASGLLYGGLAYGVTESTMLLGDIALARGVQFSVFIYRNAAVVKDSYVALSEAVKSVKGETKWYEKAAMLALSYGLTVFAMNKLNLLGSNFSFSPFADSKLTKMGQQIGQKIREGVGEANDRLTLWKEMQSVKKHLAQNEKKWAQMTDDVLGRSGVPKNILQYTEGKSSRIKEGLLADHPRHRKDLESLMNAADKNVQEIFSRSSVHMRIPGLNFKDFARSEIKNNVHLHDEDKTVVRTTAYDAIRRIVEEIHFGIKPNGEGLFRPVYGYFAHEGNHAVLEGARTAGYGNVALKLKENVKQRTLAMGMDSFPNTEMGNLSLLLHSLRDGSGLKAYKDAIHNVVIGRGRWEEVFKARKNPSYILDNIGRGIPPANRPNSTMFLGLRDSLTGDVTTHSLLYREPRPSVAQISRRLGQVAKAKDLHGLTKVLDSSYIEANIFDGVSLKDVEKVILNASPALEKETKELYVQTLGKIDLSAGKFLKGLPPVPTSILPTPPPLQRYSQARIMQERRMGNYDFPEYFQPPYDAIAFEKSVQVAKEDWLLEKFKTSLKKESLPPYLPSGEIETIFFARLHGIPVEVS